MNRNLFCSRKGGATIKGKFFEVTTSGILEKQIERHLNKMEFRQKKRALKELNRE